MNKKQEENKKEEFQKRYVEFQAISQHLNQMQQQLMLMHQQIVELTNLSNSLEDLEKVKTPAKTYSQLGSGIYVEGELKNSKKVLVNVGSDVIVPKTVSESKDMINKQLNDLKSLAEKLEFDMSQLIAHSQNLQQELTEMSRE